MVDGLGLVLGGADTVTKQVSIFKNRVYVINIQNIRISQSYKKI